jgi:arginase
MHQSLFLLGYASSIGGANAGSEEGAPTLQKSPYLAKLADKGLTLHWQAMIKPPQLPSKLEQVQFQCQQLAKETAELAQQKKFFMVFGGDHSCAIGTWSGVASVIQKKGSLGLIWVDAHMDSHTPETTPTGNIHGMPLACLLGEGNANLTSIATSTPKIKPEHICLIGIRSFEPGEKALLERLNVRIFYMDEIKQRGLDAVFAEAIQIASNGTAGYGLSIDIDSIDPADAPGTGVAEPNGLPAKALCQALTQFTNDSRLLGVEITEFDPRRDRNQQTEKLIPEMISALALGKQ